LLISALEAHRCALLQISAKCLNCKTNLVLADSSQNKFHVQ